LIPPWRKLTHGSQPLLVRGRRSWTINDRLAAVHLYVVLCRGHAHKEKCCITLHHLQHRRICVLREEHLSTGFQNVWIGTGQQLERDMQERKQASWSTQQWAMENISWRTGETWV
jgi:hypothetical protein